MKIGKMPVKATLIQQVVIEEFGDVSVIYFECAAERVKGYVTTLTQLSTLHKFKCLMTPEGILEIDDNQHKIVAGIFN